MGFAALWIFFFHSQFFTPIIDNSTFVVISLFIKNIGFCGVDIFLFLSGMGLVNSIRKNTLKQYYVNRIRRLFIPYFTICIIVAILYQWSFIKFIKELTFFNAFTKYLYDFLWFFPLITIAYLIFPALYYLFNKVTNKIAFTLLALLAWYTIAFSIRNILREDLWGLYNRFPIFIIGILFGFLSLNKSFRLSVPSVISLSVIFIMGIYFSLITYYEIVDFIIPGASCYLANLLIAVSLLFLLSLLCELLGKVRFLKPILLIFRFLGGISLELYTVQETIIYRTKDFISSHLAIRYCGITTFALVIICAYILRIYTKYILKLIDYMKNRLISAE